MKLVNHVSVLTFVSATTFVSACPMNAAGTDLAFQVPAGQRQLFLDDVGITKIQNLKRTMHAPAKKGAVIRPDWHSMEKSLQIRSAPVWDPEAKRFKIWMVSSSMIPGVAEMTYAESEDGLHWEKPILRQKEIQGTLENNVVTVDPKLEWPANAMLNVVFDPHDPDPSRRFKGFAHLFKREPIVSPDGIHWHRLNVPELPSQDESNLSYDRCSRMFIATLKTRGPYGRAQGIWTSQDFEKWTNLNVVFHADELDQRLGHERIKAYLADRTRLRSFPEHKADYTVDVYNFAVFRYGGLYVGLPSMHHRLTHRPPPGSGMDDTLFRIVQLSCSRDLKNWRRLGNREPWLDLSLLDSGAYDSGTILPPSAPLVRGPGCLDGADKLSRDQLWFYYAGSKAKADPDRFAVCLAILRRDGFISLDAGESEGTVLTKPFTAPGSKLLVNVDAPQGELSVEVLNGAGQVVAQSEPLTGDLLREPVKWATGDMAQIKGQTVSLRFTLRHARFYSYWVD